MGRIRRYFLPSGTCARRGVGIAGCRWYLPIDGTTGSKGDHYDADNAGAPGRWLLLQKRSLEMRFEKAIMTSRREFLSNALGTALVTASTWPIRVEARSMHGQSDSSTSNSERATQKISLSWDVFLAPSIPAITSDLPPGEKERPWPPISSPLISGERDAVLVDTPITVEKARTLAHWP